MIILVQWERGNRGKGIHSFFQNPTVQSDPELGRETPGPDCEPIGNTSAAPVTQYLPLFSLYFTLGACARRKF